MKYCMHYVILVKPVREYLGIKQVDFVQIDTLFRSSARLVEGCVTVSRILTVTTSRRFFFSGSASIGHSCNKKYQT